MATPTTAEEWRARAAEARAIAGALRDLSGKRTMMGIAAAYEKMARHAALVAATKPRVADEQTHSD